MKTLKIPTAVLTGVAAILIALSAAAPASAQLTGCMNNVDASYWNVESNRTNYCIDFDVSGAGNNYTVQIEIKDGSNTTIGAPEVVSVTTGGSHFTHCFYRAGGGAHAVITFTDLPGKPGLAPQVCTTSADLVLAVPGMSQTGLLILSVLLAATALFVIRRRRMGSSAAAV